MAVKSQIEHVGKPAKDYPKLLINKAEACNDYIVLAISSEEAVVVNKGNYIYPIGYKFRLMPENWEDYDGTVTLSNE